MSQPDTLMPQAVAAHQRGELEAAERHYRAVLAASPGHPDATHFLGLLLHQRGESVAALPLMEEALILEPRNHQYRSNLAGVLNQLGRAAEAERLYREALALNPDHLDSHINLGLLYAAEGITRGLWRSSPRPSASIPRTTPPGSVVLNLWNNWPGPKTRWRRIGMPPWLQPMIRNVCRRWPWA
jgi:Flp pilus assembly protein TadD